MKRLLKVLFLASEAEPFVKIGGLGDVAGSLPRVIRQESVTPQGDVDIRLVIPLHGAIRREAYDLQRVATFHVPHASGPIPAEAFLTNWKGLPVYLIGGPPIPSEAKVYSDDWGFDAHKYIYFSLAALQLARALDWPPDIVHANDWHTAAAVYWLGLNRATDPFFERTKTVLSVHNLPYLGTAGSVPLQAFGLPPAVNSELPGWANHLPLPLGLLAADRIVAVSPTYAAEILTPDFGAGLDGFLRSRADRISGIINGVDVQHWNPESDPHLVSRFSLENLAARAANKQALESEFGFWPQPEVPLLAMINRLDYQKGVDIALDALQQVLDLPWRAILLGTGLPDLEESLRQLERSFPDRVRAVIRFDAPLGRRIYAGADALLIPSRYEPCGLVQMIAMRYGCVPIARATGGLRDTISDVAQGANPRSATGFLFQETSGQALASAIRRALSAYSDKRRWRAYQRHGMQQDFSWEKSAQAYVALYRTLSSSLP